MKTLGENIKVLKHIYQNNDDIVFQQLSILNEQAYLIYISDLVNQESLDEIEKNIHHYLANNTNYHSPSKIISTLFPWVKVEDTDLLEQASYKILSGYSLLLIDGIKKFYIFNTKNKIGRNITEPTTERTARGPKEGFIEDIDQNLNLIRKKIKSPSLKVENLILGEKTKTNLSIVYMNGIANKDIVDEVKKRLSKIKIDGILESHYIQSMIKDSPKSPFPTVLSTERPDRVCGQLLDGKVAILIDGTPFALLVPVMFVEFFHSSDDYYDSSLVATIVRWVRFLGLFVTLILPAFYVALTSFHQDLLQTPFLIRIAASREALPYPVMIEAIFLLITFELLREAGIRMPKVFGGSVVTILGLVFIGQAAVQAGIIGSVMSIVISVTALTSFIFPSYDFQQLIRYCGIPILFFAGLFGFMGIIVVLMFGLTHLISLRSFGVPYFSPVSPARKEGWKDVFIRAPWWAMDTRSPGLDITNQDRAGSVNKANSPKIGEKDHE
ncbi:spore germination protein [Margalitia sp. FSL K6-0131]|uniref:spore germination protein n=1 Tax=Margalitia sp. FSL K6-0131 TaxID=2954604 RepID=UPI0030F635F6